ncbi:MAG: type III secretion system translocon subunit SctB [Kiritimatiellae bacterium]|nr:type III secretion system translocon subunit SctB [Kiritimatiellia bacterium]
MSINVNANATAVNWESLLSKLGEVTKTQGTEGAAGTTNITIMTKVDGVDTPMTIRIPDDLEMPAEVDQAAIDSLCEKLAADTGLNLTEEQIEQFHEALTNTLNETLAAAGSGKSAKANAMFDLYKLMALLVEVAQKQRDANREMRRSESEAIQASILSQAQAQRDAAITGMIAGAICCAMQAIVTVGAMIKQGYAFKQQISTLETSGVNQAKTTLTQQTESLKAYQADVMHGAENGVPLTPDARNAKIAELKVGVKQAMKGVEEAQALRQSDISYLNATQTINNAQAFNGLISAIGSMAQNCIQNAVQLRQAEATMEGAEQQKKQEELDQTKDLFNQAEELVNSVVQLMRAISQAETQSMRDAIQA